MMGSSRTGLLSWVGIAVLGACVVGGCGEDAGEDEDGLSWGVLEGEGVVCGALDKENLRQVLPPGSYTRQGRDVRAAQGERAAADGYCRLSSADREDVVVLMVEPSGPSLAAAQWENSSWPTEPFEHGAVAGDFGYRGPAETSRSTGAALVQDSGQVAAVFVDGAADDVDGAELARDLLIEVLDAVRPTASGS